MSRHRTEDEQEGHELARTLIGFVVVILIILGAGCSALYYVAEVVSR